MCVIGLHPSPFWGVTSSVFDAVINNLCSHIILSWSPLDFSGKSLTEISPASLRVDPMRAMDNNQNIRSQQCKWSSTKQP